MLILTSLSHLKHNTVEKWDKNVEINENELKQASQPVLKW